MGRLTLSLLGGFRVREASGRSLIVPTKKGQALLAYLAMRPGEAHPRDKLAALLWEDMPQDQARHNLRQTLFALRKALPRTKPPILRSDSENVILDPSAVAIDAVEFQRLAARGRAAELEQAALLYEGDLLQGLGALPPPFEEWLSLHRERLREVAQDVLARLLALHRESGATEAAIQAALRLLALDPLQEVVHRTLMELYVSQGRRGAALRQYQIVLAALQRELGAEPEPETKQLYQDILRRPPHRVETHQVRPVSHHRRGLARRFRAWFEAPNDEGALIGRQPEMTRLRHVLREAARGGGSAVAILGEAGVGKTRLVSEVVTAAMRRRVQIWLGRSYESEQLLAFSPWVDAVRAGLTEANGEALEELSAIWRAELGRLLPELAEPELQLAAATDDYRRVFEAVVHLVRHVAARRPLLIVLEDLHWADEMTLRLMAYVARRLDAWPVVIIGTAREEEIASASILPKILDELCGEERLLKLSLLALSPADSVKLIRAVAGASLDGSSLARLEDQVWAVSKGNPFVIVEIIRAFREGKTVGTADEFRLPDKIRDIIAARLARLSDLGQELVRVAALIGREFDFRLLQTAAGLGAREATEGVEELVRRRLLRGIGERFDFTHEQIREVAHDRILPPQRKFLHGQLAKALEEVYAGDLEPHYAALGLHYSQGEIWGKACDYLRKAGAQAYHRSAYREARAYFDQALAALERLSDTTETQAQAIDLRLELRGALVLLGEQSRALDHLLEAEALATALDDRRRLGFVLCFAAGCLRPLGDYDRAIAAGERALALAAHLEDVSLEIETSNYLGQVYTALGEYRRARHLLTRTVTALEGTRLVRASGQPTMFRNGRTWLVGHVSHSRTLAISRFWLGLCDAELGDFAEGIARAGKNVRDVEAAERPDNVTLTVTYLSAGALSLSKGDLDGAIPMLKRALATCQSGDLLAYFTAIASRLGYAFALSRQVAEALPLVEEAVKTSAAWKHRSGHSRWIALLSEAYLLAGRFDEAVDLASRALDLARNQKERGYEAWAWRLLGEIRAHRDISDIARANEGYRSALGLAEDLGMCPLVAHCHLGLGKLYRRMGKQQDAAEHLTTATAMYREMDMTYWLEQAEAEMKEWR